jgi:hypothetical protein
MPPFSPSVERDDAPPIDLEDYLAPDPESGEERPSFGARIAGDVPKPIPPNVAAPEDKQPAPPVQYDPGKVPEGIFAPKSPPPAPVGANNPALVSLLNRQAQDSQRINPYQTDPQTGKRTTLPQYRMGTGMRILGSIANFASGFGGKGPVAYVGPGATNARYQQDEAQRQANLASDELQIKGQQGLDTENLKLEREAQRQAFEGVKGEAAKQTAAARPQTADAQQQVADTRQQLADLKANSIDQRIADANKMSLKGEDRKYYIANGKLKEPSPLDDIRQELARQRLDDAKQARVDNVQKDAEAEMPAHKASIQKRIDALSKQVDLGEIDDSSSKYKTQIAQIERDDYAGMSKVANSLATRLKGFGVNITPPAPQPWQQSNLPDDERAKLIGGSVPGRNQAGNTSGQIQVTDPRGKIHTFRDQKSADGFKKAAGIR